MNLNDLGRTLLALSSGAAKRLSYLKHLARMVPGTTDAALSPEHCITQQSRAGLAQ